MQMCVCVSATSCLRESACCGSVKESHSLNRPAEGTAFYFLGFFWFSSCLHDAVMSLPLQVAMLTGSSAPC